MPLNLVLRAYEDYGETESTSVDVYWRWDDDDTMEPQFLARGVAGTDILTPFDSKGRDIRLFQVARTSRATRSDRSVKEGEQVVVDMAASRVAVSFGSQSANTVFAGPSSGGAADPTFRSLVIADLPAMTSAQLASKISDETGTGTLVFSTSPVLVAPILGTPNSGNLINCTGFPAAALSGMASWMPSFLTTPNVTDVQAKTFNANGVAPVAGRYFFVQASDSFAVNSAGVDAYLNNTNPANNGFYGVRGEARQGVNRSGGNGVAYGVMGLANVAGNCETAYGLYGRLSVDAGKTAFEAGAVLFGTTINGTVTTFSGLKQELINAGTVTNFYGTYTRIQNNSSATMTAVNALRISILNNGNTIPNFKGIAFEGYGGSGAITNTYLIYADATLFTGITGTTKYGIYFLPDVPSYHVGKVGIGSGATAPTARLQVIEPTLGNEVARFQSTATNDDPAESVFQNRVTTTNATQTTLHSYALTDGYTYMFEAIVTARQTGGSAGTVDDAAGYVLRATYNCVSGIAGLVGAVNADYTAESQAGWDATFTTATNNVRVRVTGATNNNITWHLTLRVWVVGS